MIRQEQAKRKKTKGIEIRFGSWRWAGPAAAFGCASLFTASAFAASIDLPSPQAYPESVTSTADGTLYIGSFAEGGILRVRPNETRAEPWIAPGAFGTRSTFGILADEDTKTLWVCSNDASAFNAPGPSRVEGSFLKSFDLSSGAGKVGVALPGSLNLCNDIAVGPDGSVYVTNSFAPEILRLKPGATNLEVWASDPLFTPPADGAGLDGIAFGGDGHLYVNTFTSGTLLRVEVEAGGLPGKVTKLHTTRPLGLPDALRPLDGNSFLMIEGTGRLDRVTISGDTASIETIADGYSQPTGVTKVGSTAFVAEGQLSRLIHPGDGGGPRLPFKIYRVALPPR
jgi:sugar lactone lactonase YvrE